MSGIILKVSPEVMQQQAASIERRVSTVKGLLDELESCVRGSRSYWEGDGSDTHIKKLDAIKQGYTGITARLAEHPRDLLQMAQVYISTDSALQEEAASLPSDIIS